MPFNTLTHSHLRTNSLSQPALKRPNVTFNYVNAKTNASAIDVHNSNNRADNLTAALLSNINYPNRQTHPKLERVKTGNQVLSHRDRKRRKIFAKSESNNDFGNLSCGTSTQNYRDFCENRQPIDMLEVKSRSSRRRNNIFQSYNPKSRIQTSKPLILKNETHKVISSLPCQRLIHSRKLTNYMQLTPNRGPKILNEQLSMIKLSAQKYIKMIPLRDTYVAERDQQEKTVPQKQQQNKNILQKDMYEIPPRKEERPFNRKMEIGQLFVKSKNTNFHNLSFEQQSIIDYSQREMHPYDQNIQDLPQLLLETNDKLIAKTEKSEGNKGELSSLVDIRLQTTAVSDKSQSFTKSVSKHNELQSKLVLSSKKPVIENMPYLLVVFGVLLLFIQLLK